MKQTTKSLVTTLGVLALAAAIGGAALWVTRDTEKKAEQKEKSAKLFDELDSGGKLVALVTRADASAPWKIVEPVAAETDASTVDAVVNGVADFKQKSELSEADPTQYGLDRPNLVVSVKTEDGKESSVEIGESNPFDSSIYVRKAGEKTVRIADGWTKAPFEKQLLDLRDKRVLHLDDTAEVRRVEVAGTAPAYALEKDGASWKMLAPQKDAADAATADRVATALAHANREDVRKIVLEQPGSPRIVVQRTKEQPKDGGFADESFTVLEPKQGPAKKWKV